MGTNKSYSTQTNTLTTLKRKKKKLKTEISDFRDAIVRLETDKVLKKTKATEELDQIISNVGSHKDQLIRELGGVQSAIKGISSSRNWVNWVHKFSDKIDNLDITNFLSTFVKNKKNKIFVKKVNTSWYEIDNQKDLIVAKKNFEK